jgi:hypothetical protein
MKDDKRLIRRLKRSIKKTGNRKRRRFLKNPTTDPDGFNFGDDSSAFMNEPRLNQRGVSSDASRYGDV